MALYTSEAKIAYIAPTYQQARDIAWEQLKRELHDLDLQINESRLELRLKAQDKKESVIFLRGWESIETLRGDVLFANISPKRFGGETTPILAINANDYRNIFKKTPPLVRMLRRQIANQEYNINTEADKEF